MRTPFLLVDRSLAAVAVGDVVALDEDQHHHLVRVLRRGDGDVVEMTDGDGGTAPAVLRGDTAVVTAPATVVPRPFPALTVVHALPKGRGLDDVVRTMAELGVARVEPVVTARTESRPRGDAAVRAADRWRAIARSAQQQARSAHRCEVSDPSALAAREIDGDVEVAVVADPTATRCFGEVLDTTTARRHVSLLIGPEGGLTTSEVDEHVERGWVAARAGDTVLRSVHAATVLVAATMALTGYYDGT